MSQARKTLCFLNLSVLLFVRGKSSCIKLHKQGKMVNEVSVCPEGVFVKFNSSCVIVSRSLELNSQGDANWWDTKIESNSWSCLHYS